MHYLVLALPLLASTAFANGHHDQAAKAKRHVRFGSGQAQAWRMTKRQGISLLAASNSTSSAVTSTLSSSAAHLLVDSTGLWYTADGVTAGACDIVASNTDRVVGISTQLWPDSGATLSPLCGQVVTITNTANGKTVRATIGDCSGKPEYTTMTEQTFTDLGVALSLGEIPITLTFDPSAASLLPNSSASSVASSISAASTDSSESAAAQAEKAPQQVTATTTQPRTTTQAAATKPTPAADSASASSKSSADAAWSSSSSKAAADAAWSVSSSSSAAAARASQQAQQAAQQAAASASSQAAAAAATASKAASSLVNFITGGFATFFYQNGNAGACGQFNSDSGYGIAMQTSRYGSGSNCGKQIYIQRTDTGASITATVWDECPTCDNENCLDLSVAAFKAIATEAEGMVPIEWRFA